MVPYCDLPQFNNAAGSPSTYLSNIIWCGFYMKWIWLIQMIKGMGLSNLSGERNCVD